MHAEEPTTSVSGDAWGRSSCTCGVASPVLVGRRCSGGASLFLLHFLCHLHHHTGGRCCSEAQVQVASIKWKAGTSCRGWVLFCKSLPEVAARGRPRHCFPRWAGQPALQGGGASATPLLSGLPQKPSVPLPQAFPPWGRKQSRTGLSTPEHWCV